MLKSSVLSKGRSEANYLKGWTELFMSKIKGDGIKITCSIIFIANKGCEVVIPSTRNIFTLKITYIFYTLQLKNTLIYFVYGCKYS